MRSHLWGTRKGPAMVTRDLLPALVTQLFEYGRHDRKSLVPTIDKARRIWRVSQSPRGDWSVGACVQAEVNSDEPVRWTCATNGMAWKHAAAGWWRTEAEAEVALEAALRDAYSDEFAAIAAAKAKHATGLASLAFYSERLESLKAQAEVVGWSSWFFNASGWSSGGQTQPYTEEAIAAFEAKVAEAELRQKEQAIFKAGVPPLFARLVALGVKTELDWSGNIRLIDEQAYRWVTPFAMTAAGLAELEAFVANEERRHTVPVVAKSLNLSGLFGGAAVVAKKK